MAVWLSYLRCETRSLLLLVIVQSVCFNTRLYSPFTLSKARKSATCLHLRQLIHTDPNERVLPSETCTELHYVLAKLYDLDNGRC
jgi:hypothetical protein